MMDWQHSNKDSVRSTLDRILDCEYPKEKYVVVGAQKGRILTANQHKNKRKLFKCFGPTLDRILDCEYPKKSLLVTYLVGNVYIVYILCHQQTFVYIFEWVTGLD